MSNGEKISRYTGPTLGDIGSFIQTKATDVMQPIPDQLREDDVKYINDDEVYVNKVKMSKNRLRQSNNPRARQILYNWPVASTAQQPAAAQPAQAATHQPTQAPPMTQRPAPGTAAPAGAGRASLTPQVLGQYIRRPSSRLVAGPTTTTTEGPIPAATAASLARAGEGGTMEQLGQAQITEQQLAASHLEDQVLASERIADIKEGHALRVQDLNARRSSASREMQAKQDQLLEEANNMEFEDFWAKKDTGSKILAGIGLMLGSFAQTARGGPNTALQIINKAIDQDLLIQKGNIEKGRARLQDMQGVYARIRQDFDDELQAENIYHIAATDKALQDIQALKANAATDMATQQLETAEAALNDQRAAYMENALLLNKQRVSQTTKMVHDKGVTVGDVVQKQRDIDFEGYDKKRYVKRAGGNARSESEAAKLDGGYDSVDRIRVIFGQMDALKEKTGETEVLNKTQKNRMNGMVQNLSTELAVLKLLGAISEGDREIVEGISGGNTLNVFNFATGNIGDLKEFVTRSEQILQSKTNPVKSETQPTWARKMQRHPWDVVHRNPTEARGLASLEQKPEAE